MRCQRQWKDVRMDRAMLSMKCKVDRQDCRSERTIKERTFEDFRASLVKGLKAGSVARR